MKILNSENRLESTSLWKILEEARSGYGAGFIIFKFRENSKLIETT